MMSLGNYFMVSLALTSCTLYVNLEPCLSQIDAEFTISIDTSKVKEGDAAATVTISATNNVINGQVNLIFCGNLVDDDFGATLASLTPVSFTNSMSETRTLAFVDDVLVEGTESLHVIIDSVQDISGSQTFTVGTTKYVVLEVSDNDAEFSFVDATQSVAEVLSSVHVYVQASYPVTDTIDIILSVVDLGIGGCGLPTAPVPAATFMCSMAMDSQYATCPVTFTGEGCFGLMLMAVDDMAGSFNVEQVISATSATTTVSVIDSAPANQISFEESTLFFGEADGTVSVVVLLSTATATVTNIPITIGPVTAGDVAATVFDDFTADTVAVVPNGGSRGTATVTIIDDTILECLESIVFGFTTPSGMTAVEPMTTTLHTEDNDAGVTVDQKRESTSVTVNEDDGCFRIGLEADAISQCPYMGSFDICGGTATPIQDIYGSCSYQLPSTSTPQQIQLCLNNDVLQEGTENIYLALNPPTSHGTTNQLLTEITIIDDEDTGANVIRLSFTGGATTGTVTENGATTIEIEASVASSFVGSVTLSYGVGDLTPGEDFSIDTVTLLFDGMITVATATITAVDDTLSEYVSESLEIYTFDSEVPVDAVSSTITLTVTDDDVGLSLFPTTVLAADGGTLNFVLLLDKPAPAAYTNVISETDISTSAADYTSPAPVNIAMNDLAVEFMYTLANSDGVEAAEVFEVVAVVGTSSVTSTVTVHDESYFETKDALLLASHHAIIEGGSAASLAFIAPGAATPNIVYDESVSTAVVGLDYPALPGSPLAVPGTLTVTSIDDERFENAEQVILVFTNDDVYPQMIAEVIIYDNENQADIHCVTPTTYVSEGDGVAVVEFLWGTLPTGGADYNIGILYADGTAEEGVDFDPITMFIDVHAVSHPATVTATVSILTDTEAEPDEKFYVYVEHSYLIAPSVATCTIVILDVADTGSTTEHPTTTERETTTNCPSTTERETTTNRPTTTHRGSTTGQPSTTERETTTYRPTTTEEKSTTNRPTTTERETTTNRPSTTERETTTNRPTTTHRGSTTGQPSTAGKTEETTTERESTTNHPSTTERETTTNPPTTTHRGSTTGQPSTASTTEETTTERGSTTDRPSTTEQKTTTNSPTKRGTTTDQPSTTGKTTEETTTAEETTISIFDELEAQLRLTIDTTGNLTTEEVEEAIEVVLEATEDSRFLEEEPERVELVINSLETLVNAGDTSVNVTDPVVEIVNNLMDVDEDVIMDGTLQGGRVVAALEEQVANAQTNEGNFSRTLENIGVTAVKIDREALGSNLAFANVFMENGTPRLDGDLRDNSAQLFVDEDDIPVERTTSSISVPTTVLDLLENAGVELTEVPVSFFIYGNAVLFTPSRPTLTLDEDENSSTNTTEVVVSQVISVTVGVRDISITKLPPGSQNVITTFITNPLGDNETQEAKGCVFWSYDDRTGEGFWSTEGCTMLEEKSDRVVCSCDRLASFAVLVRVRKGSYESQVTLYFITLIGSIISGICLVLCIITFLSLKTYRSKQPTFIHLNLCLSLLGFYVVFLLSSLATRDRVLCAIASAAVHFFCLATVAWMSVEAVNMYYLFVKIEKTKIRYFIHVACLLAYGGPVACAVLVGVLDNTSEFENADYCFIHPGFALYFGFLTEVAILFVLNFIIFIMIVRKMLCRPLMVSRTQENARRNEIITRVRHGILFWFVLGLSWVFGFISTVDENTLIFDYLYCIFIALQGVMMFLLLCVANPEFRKVFVRRIGRDTRQTSGAVPSVTASSTRLTTDSQTDSQTNIQMTDLKN